jgi:DNA-binding XRE family transcriptional regulator
MTGNDSTQSPRKNRHGHQSVYLIRAGDGLYKIGKAKSPKRRMANFQIGSPLKLVLVHAIETPHASVMEMYFHQQYAAKRHIGEWFALTDSDMEYFAGLNAGDLERLAASIPVKPPARVKQINESAKRFGELLLNYRESAGMSQDQLAERIGLSRQSISLLETGQRSPMFDTVCSIAGVFGLPTMAFLTDC